MNEGNRVATNRLITETPLFKTKRWGPAQIIGSLDDLRDQLRKDMDITTRPTTIMGRPLDLFELVVSCDSQVHRNKTDFVTAVVVKPLGTGAWGYYWRASCEVIYPKETEKRLWEEIELIHQIAMELKDMEEELLNIEFWTEIDFNGEKHTRSHKLVPGAVGYLSGSGFRVRAKPIAYCATFYAGRIATG